MPDRQPKSMPRLAFSHLGLYVRDLAAMEDFYTRALGFVVTDRGDLETPRGPVSLVFMSQDPEEHHQVVIASGRPADLPFNVVNQISFRVPDVAALRRVFEGLAGEPISEMTPVTHGNAISLYFRDPEGNRLEIFFDTPWYCAQPCRIPVDFTKTDAEIMAETERLARSLAGFCPREEFVAKVRRQIEERRHV